MHQTKKNLIIQAQKSAICLWSYNAFLHKITSRGPNSSNVCEMTDEALLLTMRVVYEFTIRKLAHKFSQNG